MEGFEFLADYSIHALNTMLMFDFPEDVRQEIIRVLNVKKGNE